MNLLTIEEALDLTGRGYCVPCRNGNFRYISKDTSFENKFLCTKSDCLEKGQTCCLTCDELESCRYRCDESESMDCRHIRKRMPKHPRRDKSEVV